MIRCPACDAENKPSTKFCHECGAAFPVDAAVDHDRTVLLPPQPDAPKRAPGTIEQAMGLPAEARKPGDRPAPTPPDNDMTVILPKRTSPPPKYEPAPPTITGPLTEPAPRRRSSRSGSDSGKSSASAATPKPKTPVIVVLALLAIAGGSAGYLGWLILKKNKPAVPAEKVTVVTPSAEPAKTPVPQVQPATPALPADVVTPAPAAPNPVVAPAPAAPAAAAPVAAATEAPAPALPKAGTPPETPTMPAAGVAETPKPDPKKTDTTKTEQLKKEQARLEAAKKEKQKKSATPVQTTSNDAARPVEAAHSAPPPAPEPAKQEVTPLALLRDDLRACEAQSVLTREFCKHQARQRRCAGMWDRVPECPVKKEDRLY